jgi:hypothetical protein
MFTNIPPLLKKRPICHSTVRGFLQSRMLRRFGPQSDEKRRERKNGEMMNFSINHFFQISLTN